MLFLPKELSAKLIITEKCSAACLFKMCTEFCYSGTRKLKHIWDIPWILSSFLSAVSSDICTSLWSPQVFLRPCHQYILDWCFIAYLFLLSFSFPCCLFSQKHNFSQNEIQQSPSAHQDLSFAVWHHPMNEEASIASAISSYDVFWPRANAYGDLLSFYFLVHGLSQAQPLSGDIPV